MQLALGLEVTEGGLQLTAWLLLLMEARGVDVSQSFTSAERPRQEFAGNVT